MHLAGACSHCAELKTFLRCCLAGYKVYLLYEDVQRWDHAAPAATSMLT
jgi:hypothetical protein